jgi:hypothetical protein
MSQIGETVDKMYYFETGVEGQDTERVKPLYYSPLISLKNIDDFLID